MVASFEVEIAEARWAWAPIFMLASGWTFFRISNKYSSYESCWARSSGLSTTIAALFR
jgi:hypothetical protein